MKLLSRDEFLKHPAPCVYAVSSGINDLCFEGPLLKTENIENDWYYMDFKTWENSCSQEYFDNHGKMLINKEGFPLDESVGRDGMFDDDCIYLVYDNSDVRKMIELLSETLKNDEL